MPRVAKGKRKTPNSRVTVEYGEELHAQLEKAREIYGFVGMSEFLRYVVRDWMEMKEITQEVQ